MQEETTPAAGAGSFTTVPALAAAPGLASRLSSGGFWLHFLGWHAEPSGTTAGTYVPGPGTRFFTPDYQGRPPAVASEGEKAPVPAPTPAGTPISVCSDSPEPRRQSRRDIGSPPVRCKPSTLPTPSILPKSCLCKFLGPRSHTWGEAQEGCSLEGGLGCLGLEIPRVLEPGTWPRKEAQSLRG